MLGVLDPTPLAEKLQWHLRSLRHADALGPSAATFYASIYANLGRTTFLLGDHDEALAYYKKAQAHVDVLGASDYAREVRNSIVLGLEQLTRCQGFS